MHTSSKPKYTFIYSKYLSLKKKLMMKPGETPPSKIWMIALNCFSLIPIKSELYSKTHTEDSYWSHGILSGGPSLFINSESSLSLSLMYTNGQQAAERGQFLLLTSIGITGWETSIQSGDNLIYFRDIYSCCKNSTTDSEGIDHQLPDSASHYREKRGKAH